MKYHVYSRLLAGYLAMDLPTREDAQEWIAQYYADRSAGSRREGLQIVEVS